MNVTERFLKYVSADTKSDSESGQHPSTPGQLRLASELAGELKQLGLENVDISEQGYVFGCLPASGDSQDMPCIGLIAHMDTSPDISGENVHARIVEYSGGDIVLNEKRGIVMRESEFQHLADYRGQHLIVTDGTTLLGADDKAGVAEIITALERIIAQGRRHARIPVCFTPDEEIGEGADFFDVPGFAADFAYTVDGGRLGEIEYENFNAANARITVTGVNIHPGDAKDKMKNAALIAVELAGLLPQAETPSHTEGYEGFFHLFGMEGSEEHAELCYLIRDHDRAHFERRKQLLASAVSFINSKYGDKTAVLEVCDRYYNMREKLEDKQYIIDRAVKAMERANVAPIIAPIRGGTDGARLSYMGLPCPNLSTGGHNFHGRFEYIPVESMEKMVDVLTELVSE